MASEQPNPANLVRGGEQPNPAQLAPAQLAPAQLAPASMANGGRIESGAVAPSNAISAQPFPMQDAAPYSFDSVQQTPISAQGASPQPDPANLMRAAPTSAQVRHQQENLSTAYEGVFEDPLMAAQILLEGLTYGWGEEVAAGFASAAAWMTQDSSRPKKSWGYIYDDMVGHLELEREAYVAEHPKAAMALELTGGVLSPLNKIIFAATAAGGAFGLTKVDDLLNVAGKAFPKSKLGDAQRVQRSLKKLESRPAGQTALDKATNISPETMLQRGVRVTKETIPSAAVGGALYAAGKSENINTDDMKERLSRIAEDAKTGAKWGTALAPLAGMIRMGGDMLTRRGIANQLQQGDNFVPINVAVGPGDSKFAQGLQWVYRNIIGKAWLSSSMIQNQQKRWQTAIMSRHQLAKKELQRLKARLSSLEKSIAAEQKRVTAKLADELKEGAALKNQGSPSVEAAKLRAQEAIRKAREAQAKELTAMIQIIQNRFRNEIVRDAIPAGATKKEINDILATMESGDFLALNSQLRDLWQKRGFSMLHDRSFAFGADTRAKLIADIQNLIDGDQNIRSMKLDGVADNAAEIIEDFFTLNVNATGRMDGSAVVNLRNRISDLTKGQPGSTSDSIQLDVLKNIRTVLDNHMLSQLSPNAAAMFRRHQAQWRTRLGMDKSISNTAGLSGKPNQAGVFEVKDWVNTTRQIWPFEAKDGRAPFQRVAMGYDSDITRATQSLDNITDTQLSDIVTERIQSISSIIADKEAEKFALQRALDASAEREGVRISTAQARATLVAGDPSASRIAGLETEIALMKQQLEQVKNVFAKPNASVVEKSLMAYALSLGTNVFGGVLVAGGAASRPGQNFLAGQTGWQAWVQRQLREGANVRQRQATRDAGVLGFDSSLIGQAGAESITESNMNAILKASLPVKRQYYNRLEAKGQLQRVRAFYPQQLKQLEEDISPN